MFSVLLRLLLRRSSRRHRQAVDQEPGRHVHVRPEHDRGGVEAALVAANHSQSITLFPVRSALHGSRFLL